MKKWIAPFVTLGAGALAAAATYINANAGTLTQLPVIGQIAVLALTTLGGAVFTDTKSLFTKKPAAGGHVPPLPGTPSAPTISANDLMSMYQRFQDLQAGKAVEPDAVIVPQNVDQNGRFVIDQVEMRDTESLHHLASRATTAAPELRGRMSALTRQLSDCVYELHHGPTTGKDAPKEGT